MGRVRACLVTRVYLVLVVCLLGISTLQAEELPKSLLGVTVVAAKALYPLPTGVKLIDVRPLHDHFSARIPDSLHIAYRERSLRSTSFDPENDDVGAFLTRLHKFVPDKTSPLILYCNGLQCWKSYKAASAAVKDGYSRVSWFRGGMAEWESLGLPVQSDEESHR